MRNDSKNQPALQTGAVMVEFALLLPLLMVLVVGICEMSFVFFHLNILNKSVQDAARYFSDPKQAKKGIPNSVIDLSSLNQAAINATKNLVIYGSISNSGNSLMPSATKYTVNITSPLPNHIQVTANYQHDFMLKGLLNSVTGGKVPADFYTLTASAVMRVE